MEHLPDSTWKHFDLYEQVKKAILALAAFFESETHIEGISATDIFTLNSALGATIEDQVVAALNRNRAVWDPLGRYTLYTFKRQPQTFPDVVLRKTGGDEIILGVELKGWYLLSKEGEPSFRYTVTPAACAAADLLIVVPWALKNVLSGSPRVFDPYVISARYAAELRNYHWMHTRNAQTNPSVASPPSPPGPYPSKSDQIADRAVSDNGGNFGRYARTGLMDKYICTSLAQPICGIPARAWLEFFKIFTESLSDEDMAVRMDRIRKKFRELASTSTASQIEPLRQILSIIEAAL